MAIQVLSGDTLTALNQIFDLLSQTPGAIIYRGPERWEALEPANVGDILELGPDLLPRWVTPT